MRAKDAIDDLKAGKRRYYHPGQKDYATFLETSKETGGERTLIEIELAPGGGNVPHYHLTYDGVLHRQQLHATRPVSALSR